jgi:adenylosuccinate lyase
MAADARECRQRASRCAELAMTARTTQLKAFFLALSKNWEQFAIELEDSFGRLVEMETLRSNVRGSLSETKRLSDLLGSKNGLG